MVDFTSLSLSIIGASESPADIFGTALNAGDNSASASAQSVITAHKREINRIRGYKLQLTPAENERLAKLQEKIKKLNQKAVDGTIRPDEIRARSEYFRQADRIIGKPSVDVEADATLKGYTEQIDELLAPKLRPAEAKRLELLEKLRDKQYERLYKDPSNKTVLAQSRNLTRLIETLAPARPIHELKESEKKEYDALVLKVNEHAHAKLLLDAKESVRVYELQRSIDQLSELLPEQNYNQLTAARAATVYARIR